MGRNTCRIPYHKVRYGRVNMAEGALRLPLSEVLKTLKYFVYRFPNSLKCIHFCYLHSSAHNKVT